MGDEWIMEIVLCVDEVLYWVKWFGCNWIEVYYGLMVKSSDGEKGWVWY